MLSGMVVPCNDGEQVLVVYKVRGAAKEYKVWMSCCSFKELEWLVPLEYCRILEKK